MGMNLKDLFRRKRLLTIDEIIGGETRAITKKSRRKDNPYGALSFGGVRAFVSKNSMQLPAVYRCVELISNSVAQLPLEPYSVDARGFGERLISHPCYHLLNCEPSARMTRFTFVKTMVTSMLLDGNGYAFIQRDKSETPVALHYIPSEFVTPEQPASLAEPLVYSITGVDVKIPASEMIHILNFSYDGIIGVSTLQHAAHTLGLARNAEKHSSGFFANGCNIGGIIKVPTSLGDKQKSDMKAAWKAAFNPETGEPNGVALLTNGMDYQPISINPKDAMLLESRRFSVEDICRFFGVDPTKCGDLSKSSYNTLEQTTQAFLNDTLTPILEKIELELERKLFPVESHSGIEVRFDTSQLLRGDKAAQASFYSSLFAIGAITPNEIRKEQGLPPVPGGDNVFVQVNVQTLERATTAPDAVNVGSQSEKKENSLPGSAQK